MSPNPAAATGETTDPRVLRTRTLVHEATIEILVEDGFEGFSIESVAQRAGVARTTIYRNWSGKAQLVIDAFSSLSAPPESEPTGDLRVDLMVVLGHLGEELPRARWASVLAALVAAAEHDEDLAREKMAMIELRQAPLLSVISAAIDSGRIRPGTDPEVVLSMLAGPLFFRRLMTEEPVDREFAAKIVDVVLSGVGYEP